MTKKKKITIITVSVLIFVAIITAGICIGINMFKQKPEPAVGVAGKITDGWDVGNDDADSKPSSGTQIPGYSTAEMNEGDMELHLSIGNPKSNTCGFYATLKLEDGTVLYKSELIKPGYGLTEVPLTQSFERGKYKAVVFYECVTLDEKELPLNSAESEFTLIVN